MLVRLATITATRRGPHVAVVALLSAVLFAALTLPTEAAKGGRPGKPTASPSPTATPTPEPTPAPTAPVFTAQTPPASATVGVAYSYTFAASGDPAPIFGLWSGTLPPGLAVASNGVFAGTPSQAGSYNFWVYASNSGGTTVTSMITINVSPGSTSTAPVFISQSPPTSATVGVAYGYSFSASGDPTPTYGVWEGALPPGLSLVGSGALSGTPSQAGSYSFRVYASNSAGTAATSTITISVAPGSTSALAIAPFPQPIAASYGQALSYQFTATGGTPGYAFYWVGNMPAGLSLSSSGLLSGVVLAAPGQDFTIIMYVLDSASAMASTGVWIKIAP